MPGGLPGGGMIAFGIDPDISESIDWLHEQWVLEYFAGLNLIAKPLKLQLRLIIYMMWEVEFTVSLDHESSAGT